MALIDERTTTPSHGNAPAVAAHDCGCVAVPAPATQWVGGRR